MHVKVIYLKTQILKSAWMPVSIVSTRFWAVRSARSNNAPRLCFDMPTWCPTAGERSCCAYLPRLTLPARPTNHNSLNLLHHRPHRRRSASHWHGLPRVARRRPISRTPPAAGRFFTRHRTCSPVCSAPCPRGRRSLPIAAARYPTTTRNISALPRNSFPWRRPAHLEGEVMTRILPSVPLVTRQRRSRQRLACYPPGGGTGLVLAQWSSCRGSEALLEKWLPTSHQNWLPIAHYQYAAGITPLVFSYP
jgi:hypothetical protein